MIMKTSISQKPVGKASGIKVPKTGSTKPGVNRKVAMNSKSAWIKRMTASPSPSSSSSSLSSSLSLPLSLSLSPCKPAIAPLAPRTTGPTTPLMPKTTLAPPSASSGSGSSSPPLAAADAALTTGTATAANMNLRSIWYLGGNQMIKLLTSVDGDLDHAVLANIAEVPAVVGDLALSVESLVSDDFTVGGFESDLLAQIASNTLAVKRVAVPEAAAAAPMTPAGTTTTASSSNNSSYNSYNNNTPQAPFHTNEETYSTTFGTVPDPLANYQPVPNPLARITPPGSPLPNADVVMMIEMR